ncbi:hypothetical protein GCM10010331_40270 [Streptomyces xanthochromogenes]|nr:hypothetical protein GCM10010331_40270 [Streptomyces xanthochromogenes]
MSSLKAVASVPSAGSAATGLQPACARCWLTSDITVAAADTSALGNCTCCEGAALGGALGGAAGPDGAGAGASDFFRGAGGAEGVAEAGADGVAEALGEEGAADGVGDAALLDPAGAGAVPVGFSDTLPCGRTSGVRLACTRGPVIVSPLTLYVPPPGSRPEATATAPTATAAETPSSPVRTGAAARFLRRDPPRGRPSGPAAGSAGAGSAAERRWRPICGAFLNAGAMADALPRGPRSARNDQMATNPYG